MIYIYRNITNLNFCRLFSLILTNFIDLDHLKYFRNIKNALTHVEIRKEPQNYSKARS